MRERKRETAQSKYAAKRYQSNHSGSLDEGVNDEGYVGMCCGSWDDSLESEEDGYVRYDSLESDESGYVRHVAPDVVARRRCNGKRTADVRRRFSNIRYAKALDSNRVSRELKIKMDRLRSCRRVTYRRRLLRRERVDVETGEAKVVMKKRGSQFRTMRNATTFGWIPNRAAVAPLTKPKKTDKKTRQGLGKVLASHGRKLSLSLTAPAHGTITILKSKFFALKKSGAQNVKRLKISNRLRFILQWFTYENYILSMKNRTRKEECYLLPFDDEIEVEYNGSNNKISIPVRESYHALGN